VASDPVRYKREGKGAATYQDAKMARAVAVALPVEVKESHFVQPEAVDLWLLFGCAVEGRP
jgi:hypothetical protein